MSIISIVVLILLNLKADRACDGYTSVFSEKQIDDLPNATNQLYDKKNYSKYASEIAFDKKHSTSWVEGKKGDEI